MIENLNGIRETVDYHGDFRIRVYLNREYEDYPLHWHTDAEIIMPVEQGYQVTIDEVTYDLEDEDIIIIPPGELHQLKAPPEGCRIILQFDCTLLYSFNGFDSAFHMFRPCVTVTPSSAPDVHRELSRLVLEITSEYFSSRPFREASAYSMLIRFFTGLGRSCMNRTDGSSGRRSQKQHEYIDLFFHVCNYINNHCTENIKIEDMADIAGFSKYHFARRFKEVMNISCYDYLISRRIMHAEGLLLDPELTIMQVAMKSGFSSLATFNRVFKAKKHCTPREYKAFHVM